MHRSHIRATELRGRFSQVLKRVSGRGDRIVLEKHDKELAAVISIDDFKLLEFLEDRYDLELSRAALAESEERTPFTRVKERLGV